MTTEPCRAFEGPLSPAGRVLNSIELTSMIFSFIKGETYPPSAREVRLTGMSTTPGPRWKAPFAGWARVNRAFFEASTAILWESMDSLEPFFCTLLPVDTTPDGETNEISYSAGVSSRDWERFSEYSRKTRALSLYDRSPPQIFPAWAFYLTAKMQSGHLFPRLEELHLALSDNLSLLIAFSVCRRLSSITIDLESDIWGTEGPLSTCTALTAAVSEENVKLKRCCLLRPFNPVALKNITKLKDSLTHFHLSFDDELKPSVLPSIQHLRHLKELSLEQEPWSDNDLSFPLAEDLEVEPYLSRSSQLPELRLLSAKADGLYLFMIATELAPSSLTALRLEVDPDSDAEYSHMLLIPLVLTIHATRNPSLTSLEVLCPRDLRRTMDPNEISHLRHDTRLNTTRPLLAALSGLRDLVVFRISGIPFLSPDIAVDLIEVASSIPQLQLIEFAPKRMTFEDEDELVWPGLNSLESLSRNCPHLTDVDIYIDIQGVIPEPPKDYISWNKLPHLSIRLAGPVEGLAFATERKLAISRYVDRIFPQLKSLATCPNLTREEQSLWADVLQIIVHSQGLREQARRDHGIP